MDDDYVYLDTLAAWQVCSGDVIEYDGLHLLVNEVHEDGEEFGIDATDLDTDEPFPFTLTYDDEVDLIGYV